MIKGAIGDNMVPNSFLWGGRTANLTIVWVRVSLPFWNRFTPLFRPSFAFIFAVFCLPFSRSFTFHFCGVSPFIFAQFGFSFWRCFAFHFGVVPPFNFHSFVIKTAVVLCFCPALRGEHKIRAKLMLSKSNFDFPPLRNQ